MTNLCINALSVLLRFTPYDSSIWSLFSCCRTLRNIKSEVKLLDNGKEHRCRLWLVENYSGIKPPFDIFFFDDDKNLAYVWCKKRAYHIPVEWIKYFYTCDGRAMLVSEPFCCRAVCVKSISTVLSGIPFDVPEGLRICRSTFHIGHGTCITPRTTYNALIEDLNLCFGWMEIGRIIIEEFLKEDDVISGFFGLKPNERDSGFNGLDTLKHAILCKSCNEKYFKIFVKCAQKYGQRHQVEYNLELKYYTNSPEHYFESILKTTHCAQTAHFLVHSLWGNYTIFY